MLFTEQSAAAQAAFASLSQAARQRDLQRSIADLDGGFTSKSPRRSGVYWYYQYKLPGGKPQQIYIGPDDEATRALMAEHKNPAAKSARSHLAQLCEVAEVMGCYSVIPKHARVLARLADHGWFRAGGVLIGTHAYLGYQNRLGVLWQGGAMTLDLDFAHPGKNVSVAINADLRIDTHAAVDSLKMGFLPVNEGTRYVKEDEPDFDLDFLTCTHRGGDAPVKSRQLNVTLQPLKFLEFAMQDPIVSVLVTGGGPIVVNLPRPERYALGKLILYRERLAGTQPEKAEKDLMQAASLIEYFLQRDPDALHAAWADLWKRGPGWKARATEGLTALHSRYPAINFASI